MPYCPNCGTKNSDTARFCEACGTPLGTAAQAQPQPPASAPASGPTVAGKAESLSKSFGSAKDLIIVAVAIYAFATPLGFLVGGPIGFIAGLLALLVVYALAAEPIRKGNVAQAKTGTMIVLGLSILYVVINVALGGIPGAVLNGIAALALGAAYMQLKP